MTRPLFRPTLPRSLSARLLVLTFAFVLLAEVLIYVPSIARFRRVYLEERIGAAHLATLSLEAAPDGLISEDLEQELLSQAGVLSVTLREPAAELMLGLLPPVEKVYDLRTATPEAMIRHAFDTLWHGGDRTIRVIAPSPARPEVLVDVSLSEQGMWNAMVGYSWRILTLSIVISVVTALLVFSALQVMIVRPLRRITDSVIAFRSRPEDASVDLPPSERRDEIGLVQTELSSMQRALRSALAQKTRLAAVGTAVSKINHDLRNILASAMVVSDRLEHSQDPEVRHVTPRLLEALDRAARLCSATVNFSRAEASDPQKTRVALAPLLDEVGEAVLGPDPGAIRWRNEVGPDIRVLADRDQLYRVLLNLGRNAAEALPGSGGLIAVTAWESAQETVIEIADTGRGIPKGAQAHLFEAFSGSARPGGTGLGLPIAREIMRAHGGDLVLAHTGEDGTAFRLTLPAR
ncbi:MAG TPA: HAMP domain-containing sensor histidine kinase [Geminicoccaceae bacterium]|nr:HAMP domain-containing sensor histidine kinase [Geminicoccaceae bacterium]